MVTVKGTETKSTHLSASIVKEGILSKWSGDKSGGAQDHIPFKFIFDGFNSVRFWHIADISTDSLQSSPVNRGLSLMALKRKTGMLRRTT